MVTQEDSEKSQTADNQEICGYVFVAMSSIVPLWSNVLEDTSISSSHVY